MVGLDTTIQKVKPKESLAAQTRGSWMAGTGTGHDTLSDSIGSQITLKNRAVAYFTSIVLRPITDLPLST